MKPFRFSLERMRTYKNQLLDREKSTLKVLQQRQNEIEDRLERMIHFREQKSQELIVKQQKGITVQEMDIYRLYIENARLQIKQLEIDQRIAAVETERQLKMVVRASQEVSGLDKLEEKQLQEYQQKTAKEQEQIISELLIGGSFQKTNL